MFQLGYCFSSIRVAALLSVAFAVSAQLQLCPNSVIADLESIYYTTHGSTCFALYIQKKTWQEANSFCKDSAPNGRLAKLDFNQLPHELSNLLPQDKDVRLGSKQGVWVGGYTKDSQTWFWTSYKSWPFSDDIVNASAWSLWRPKNGSGDCMSGSSSYQLYANDCQQQKQFLCAYECVKVIATNGTEVELKTPLYPSPYPSATRCEWVVDIGKGQAVAEFEGMGIAPGDFLEIKEFRNSTKIIEKFFGTSKPGNVYSSSQHMHLTFISNETDKYEGFFLRIYSLSDSKVVKLYGHGIVTSAFYPSNYPNSVTMKWLLSVEKGTIILKFTDFDLQPGSEGTCKHDRLMIKEGGADGAVIGTYCSNTRPENITSSTGVLFLQMETDLSFNAKGFRAVFHRKEDSCVFVISAAEGQLASPSRTKSSSSSLCAWYIDVQSGVAKMFINDFRVDDCKDQVVMFGGHTSNHTHIGPEYDCGSLPPQRITSDTRYLTVYFSSHASFSKTVIDAHYNSSENCSYFRNRDNGFIDGASSAYDPYTNCTWLIDVKDETAALTFDYLKTTADCSKNRVEVYDGNTTDSKLIFTFCNNKTTKARLKAKGSSQYLLVKMVTDPNENGNWFKAFYYSSIVAEDCPFFLEDDFHTDNNYVWNNTCYAISETNYTWSEGLGFCSSSRTSLFYIESPEERSAIKDWISSLPGFIPELWTSGYNDGRSPPRLFWRTKSGNILIKDGAKSKLWARDAPTAGEYVYYLGGDLHPTPSFNDKRRIICKEKAETKRTPPIKSIAFRYDKDMTIFCLSLLANIFISYFTL